MDNSSHYSGSVNSSCTNNFSSGATGFVTCDTSYWCFKQLRNSPGSVNMKAVYGPTSNWGDGQMYCSSGMNMSWFEITMDAPSTYYVGYTLYNNSGQNVGSGTFTTDTSGYKKVYKSANMRWQRLQNRF